MVFQAGVVSEWASDGKQFLLEHFDTILNSPSHIYHSVLPLSPSSSWLYKNYIAEASPIVKIVQGVPVGWGVCSRTTLLSSPTPTLSHHGNSIAVGCWSGDIIILNAITGSQSAVLSEHTSPVRPAQVRRRRSLLHPGELRGMVLSPAGYQWRLRLCSEQRQTNRRLSRWHPGSKSSPNDSASLLTRTMSRNEKEE